MLMHVYVSLDLDGAQYLLENVPNIKDEFDIISKIGEGMCTVK